MTIPDGITEAQNYKNAPEGIRASVEQLIRDYGSDPALLAGAVVSATSRAIQAAQEAERERCARICEDYEPPAYTDVDNACIDLATAIRKGA